MMKPARKMRMVAMVFILAMLVTTMPVKALVSESTSFIPSIEIRLAGDITVTLTNVYPLYRQEGFRMSIFMAQDGTITFNNTDASWFHTLYAGTAYAFAELSEDGSAVSFNVGRDAESGTYKLVDYMGLVGGRYEWAVQLMINEFATLEQFVAALGEGDIGGLRSHEVIELPDTVIPAITIRPPGIFEDDDLTITFTNVYDAIGRADLAAQSQIWFYVDWSGSIRFNRDIELTSYIPYSGETVEVIQLGAGEVLYVSQHVALGFHYGDFPVYGHHYATSRSHDISFHIVREAADLPGSYHYRVSHHAVNADASVTNEPEKTTDTRILRFAIGSTTFTDNGANRTLEAAPFIQNDRTMVPLRVIGEALGATDLAFNAGVITFNIDGQAFTMTVGQALPNNMGTPVIIAGRTFVPLAFIIDEMGATARWDGAARAAYIYIH